MSEIKRQLQRLIDSDIPTKSEKQQLKTLSLLKDKKQLKYKKQLSIEQPKKSEKQILIDRINKKIKRS